MIKDGDEKTMQFFIHHNSRLKYGNYRQVHCVYFGL